MFGTASFDRRGVYRYRLGRLWDETRRSVAWIMLNPSTATASADDATIRRVADFSRAWGFGSVEVVNLFALRATHPRQLGESAAPVGPDNDDAIAAAVSGADQIIAAWGDHGTMTNPITGVPRFQEVLDLVAARSKWVCCLAKTKHGQPRHPLYMPADTKPVPFTRRRVDARKSLR